MPEKRVESGPQFSLRRQLVCREIESLQVMEPWLVRRDRCVERREASGQDLNALEIGMRSVERPIEFALYSINCRIRAHEAPTCSHTDKGQRSVMVPVIEDLILMRLTKREG